MQQRKFCTTKNKPLHLQYTFKVVFLYSSPPAVYEAKYKATHTHVITTSYHSLAFLLQLGLLAWRELAAHLFSTLESLIFTENSICLKTTHNLKDAMCSWAATLWIRRPQSL